MRFNLGGWVVNVCYNNYYCRSVGLYTKIIFKLTKIISLLASWYSKNHLHRSLIFHKIVHHRKVHEKFMSSSLYLKIEKNYENGHNHISLFNSAHFYVFFLLKEFIISSTAHSIYPYENLSVYSITANANPSNTWVSSFSSIFLTAIQ